MPATATPPVTPEKKSTRKTATDKLAQVDAITRTGRSTAKKPAPEKAPRFPSGISDAVRYARMELHAKNPSRKQDARPPAASAGDHIRVREHVTEMVGQ